MDLFIPSSSKDLGISILEGYRKGYAGLNALTFLRINENMSCPFMIKKLEEQ